jgi:RNase adaptor protein for sRNA GlmZ degradation
MERMCLLVALNKFLIIQKKLNRASIILEINSPEESHKYEIFNNINNKIDFVIDKDIKETILYLSADRVGVLDIYEKNRNDHFLDPKR